MREITEERDRAFADGVERIDVEVAEQGIALRASGASLHPAIVCRVSRQALTPHITEYADVVRRLAQADEGYGSARFDALDMAKKVTHDAGARALMTECPDLAMNHPTARRFFSLVFALRVETTHLTGVRSHRPIR